MIDADTRNSIELRREAVCLDDGAALWSAGGRTVNLPAGRFVPEGSAAANPVLAGIARSATRRASSGEGPLSRVALVPSNRQYRRTPAAPAVWFASVGRGNSN